MFSESSAFKNSSQSRWIVVIAKECPSQGFDRIQSLFRGELTQVLPIRMRGLAERRAPQLHLDLARHSPKSTKFPWQMHRSPNPCSRCVGRWVRARPNFGACVVWVGQPEGALINVDACTVAVALGAPNGGAWRRVVFALDRQVAFLLPQQLVRGHRGRDPA